MSSTLEGGCLCGSVRYTIKSDPQMTVICHCRDCQRTSGAPFAASMMFPKSDVSIDGDVHCHTNKADSGNDVERGFCPTCGSHILARSSGYPDGMVIAAGTLDDPSVFKAGLAVYCRSALNGISTPADIPAFDAMPPS